VSAVEQGNFYICPECFQGKHGNCNGIANQNDDNTVEACFCRVAAHPNRQPLRHPATDEIMVEFETEDKSKLDIDGMTFVVSQQIDRKTRQILDEKMVPLPGINIPFVPLTEENSADAMHRFPPVPVNVPENDPGILAEAFPEVVEDRYFNVRMKPNRAIIQDLLDVEVENDNGDWVPLVPAPFASYLWLNRCLCGKFRLGIMRYQEHYAYAHILGMDEM